MTEQELQEIEQIIDYHFSDPELLRQTFIHSSSANNRHFSNERLEFFGDSVLSLIICEELFRRFPKHLEGNLTKIKSMLVSRRTCSKVLRKLNLHNYLCLGKGMIGSKAIVGSIAAGLLEALIAAIYLDGGFEAAKKFILTSFDKYLTDADEEIAHGNFKSLLQQYAQQHFNAVPIYEMLDEKGPDHNKCFETQVVIDKYHYPSAWGMNKKESEQKAAFNALVALGILEEEIES
ncbi:MAG: ribonuclease III [Phycisphaerae bacterium]|nr:ribonuclease III [Phycisphaerae bacterium]